MENEIKTVAFYLPQFHEIPENNKWWGKGFTEWTNVKKAKPLFEGHYQPRIPYENNYYDLSKKENIKQQAELARKYGINGFCIYHYWFNGKKLLEKPLEILLQNKEIDIEYCICWANESWTNAWTSSSNKVLIEQTYGSEEEWSEHFKYFLKFFKDKRYMREDGKPILIIYRPELIPDLNKMLDYWEALAKDNGFKGICYGYQQSGLDDLKMDQSRFTLDIEYQPKYALKEKDEKNVIRKIIRNVVTRMNNGIFKNNNLKRSAIRVRRYNYDEIWNNIINRHARSDKSVAGAFVDWDNTPRRGVNGFVIDGASPEKFEKYLKMQFENIRNNYHNNYLFIFAWNEWAEGGYLEPDKKFNYGYLEAVKNAKGQKGLEKN